MQNILYIFHIIFHGDSMHRLRSPPKPRVPTFTDCMWLCVQYMDFPNPSLSTRGDWLLGFLYRSSAAQLSVAGLQPVNVDDRRIVNVDLSSVVSHHSLQTLLRTSALAWKLHGRLFLIKNGLMWIAKANESTWWLTRGYYLIQKHPLAATVLHQGGIVFAFGDFCLLAGWHLHND